MIDALPGYSKYRKRVPMLIAFLKRRSVSTDQVELESCRFVIGDDITLADFVLGSTLGFAAAASIPWDSYENIRAWYQRLDQMPARRSCAPPPGIAS